MAADSDLQHLRDVLRVFADERDWNQFHTPKNLCMALMVEVAELMERSRNIHGPIWYAAPFAQSRTIFTPSRL